MYEFLKSPFLYSLSFQVVTRPNPGKVELLKSEASDPAKHLSSLLEVSSPLTSSQATVHLVLEWEWSDGYAMMLMLM